MGLTTPPHKTIPVTETQTRVNQDIYLIKKVKERKEKKAALNSSRTRAEKVKAQIEYREANKNVKKSLKTDKRNYIEALALEAEEAARHENLKNLTCMTPPKSWQERPVNLKDQ